MRTYPPDLIRVLLEGAAIVHFANTLNAFREAKKIPLSLSLFGIMATQLAILYFSSSTTMQYVVLCIGKLAGSAVVGLLQSKGTFVG
jgi:hypothetical protein